MHRYVNQFAVSNAGAEKETHLVPGNDDVGDCPLTTMNLSPLSSTHHPDTYCPIPVRGFRQALTLRKRLASSHQHQQRAHPKQPSAPLASIL